MGAVALPTREPPALPAPPRRGGDSPGGGMGVRGGGRSRAGYTDIWRSPSLWPQHHRPGGVRPVGAARRGHGPLLVAGPVAGVAGRLLMSCHGHDERFPGPPPVVSGAVAPARRKAAASTTAATQRLCRTPT